MQQTTNLSIENYSVRITEQSDIELIITALSTARKVNFTRKNAMDELPLQEANNMILIISTYTSDGRMTGRFLLFGGEFVYVEYSEIYKISGNKYAEIYKVFTDNTAIHPYLIIEWVYTHN